MAEEVMTPQEVADLYRVPVKTLYAWKLRGEGPKVSKVGRHLRYRRADCERWFDEQAAPAAS